MRRIIAFTLFCLLCFTAILPIAAASVPHNTMVASTQELVTQTVGTDTPGAAIVLYDGGQRVMLDGFGYAVLSERSVVKADTAFELGELSSLFTLLAVQMLHDEGLLDLTADIAIYLPESFMKRLSLTHSVTVEDLLFSMAGFAGRTFDLRFAKDSYCFDTLEEALLARIPEQIASPGTYYGFSPFSIGLAAYVVECVAGKPFDDYIGERILTPLGMHDTVLDARADARPQEMAAGHLAVELGRFSSNDQSGYSYSGIMPADGAVSTAADLALLMDHLLQRGWVPPIRQNGVFTVGIAGARVANGLYALTGNTAFFGASLCFDMANGRAGLVLINTPRSALCALPLTLCGFLPDACNLPSGELLELSSLKGVYANALFERKSLVGRLRIKDDQIKVEADEQGMLRFGDRTLRQIARGVFADTAEETETPFLQFLVNEEGEVTAVLCADGSAFFPVSLWERELPLLLLFFLLLAGAVYLLLGGMFSTIGALRARARFTNDKERDLPAWRFTLPWAFAGLVGLLVLLQVWVAVSFGNAAIASFFTAASVIALLLAIAAILSFLLAFFTAFTERGRTSRVVRAAIIFVLFLFLCVFWNVIYI